jgi:glyoxylase-like metal-dependent hydrolase (beta-lactamase superfamily II)
VLRHPKGNIIFDTGNNDKTIADPNGWWGPLAKGFGLKMTKDDAIPAQLAKIGMSVKDIKYVVIGHMHLDHGGNVQQFPHATLVVQDDEMKAAWWPDVGYSVYYIPGDFNETKGYNVVRLNGDLDLFGDGSFRIIRGRGHTPEASSPWCACRRPARSSSRAIPSTSRRAWTRISCRRFRV